MTREKSRSKRLKSESDLHSTIKQEEEESEFSQIFKPIKHEKKYKALYDDEEDYPFIKLLEAINMRAIGIPLQSQFPKMDLSALYCLGITIQEYARHLSTNILSQKRASENLPPLNTLFSQEELGDRSLSAIIEKYKPTTQKIQPVPTVQPRPNIEQEMSKKVRQKKSHMDYPLTINTTKEESYYEKMLRMPEWEGLLRKNRDPEAAALVALVRRENNDRLMKKRKLEQEAAETAAAVEKEEKLRQQQQREKEIKQEQFLPPTPPADIFDMASSAPSSSQKKKKSSHSSSSHHHKKKKKKISKSGF